MSVLDQLLKLKSQGKLRVVSSGGIARSLTTAVSKMLVTQPSRLLKYEGFIFDGHLNEEFSWGNQRIERGYEQMLEVFQAKEIEAVEIGRDLLKVPIHIIAKNNSHHFSQKSWESFLNLADCHFLSIRNPVLSFSSLINNIIEKILEKNIFTEYQDELQKARANRDYSNLSLKLFNENITADFLDIAKTSRDLRNLAHPILNSQFFKSNLCYHRCIDEELKLEVWQEIRETITHEEAEYYAKDSGFSDWETMIKQYITIPSNEFDLLPDILRKPLEFYRTGWRALNKVIKATETTNKTIFVFDATDMQLFPEEFLLTTSEVMEKVGIIPSRERKSAPSTKNLETVKANISFNKALTLDYIHEPIQKPLPLDKIPLFLHQKVIESLEIYIELLKDKKRIWIPKNINIEQLANRTLSNGQTLRETDPIYLYSRASLFKQNGNNLQLNQSLRKQFPEFTIYFDTIDTAMEK